MKYVTTKNVAEATTARQKAEQTKSTFNTSRFRNGQRLTIVGYDFVVDDDSNLPLQDRKAFPVLTTELGGKPFDPIWLSMLCREVTTADGAVLVPSGSLNKKAIELVEDSTVLTDKDVLEALVAFCKDKTVICKRTKTFKRLLRSGDIVPSTLPEFDVE